MPDTKQPDLLESFRSERFVSVYSNSMNLEVTPWDFKLIVGVLLKGQKPNEPPKIENLVEVVMSPQHAKALLSILASNVQAYEKQVGEIKLPEQFTNPEQQTSPSPKT
jgi:hypothetical protein